MVCTHLPMIEFGSRRTILGYLRPQGNEPVGGVKMPAGQMGVVALDELVLHGWDLARATGQSFTCDPADTAAVLAFTSASARPEHAVGREGLFGPVVKVPAEVRQQRPQALQAAYAAHPERFRRPR